MRWQKPEFGFMAASLEALMKRLRLWRKERLHTIRMYSAVITEIMSMGKAIAAAMAMAGIMSAVTETADGRI